MILSIQNVVKRYEHHVAVNHVSFDVPRGSVFGLLGPNGAGKTSLIRMITTITAPDEGAILFDGHKINAETPRRIGYMPEERGLYKKMKVGEQLLYLARLKGLSATEARQALDYWLNKFEITDWWNKKVEELSKGMQQKIQFIATVVHRPPLLILDEPFSGLDPINTALIKDEIRQLNEQGASIIFSTHRMEQVEEMCRHVVLINKGQNVLEGEVKNIKADFKQNHFLLDVDGEWPADFAEHFAVVSRDEKGTVVHLPSGHGGNELLSWCIDRKLPVRHFEELLPTFNEIFIRRVQETQ
ncbi:MAG: ABC transporter ATP-binding protein [Saprospiraceae bacterium]|nr:ABC transporter ATP-binding protein [Saprospiraceae bacterium]